MKKQRIVLASILKPVNDTRMFEKFALSLAQLPNSEIHLVGHTPSEDIQHNHVHIHKLGTLKRISFSRWLASWKVFSVIYQLRPHILIITTHELLMVGCLAKILFCSKLVYDIQENYYRNIKYGEGFPSWLGFPIALWVRFKEKLTASIVNHSFLAESNYQHEMKFFGKKFTVIENKCKVPANFERRPHPQQVRLLFSGTLSQSSGVVLAIDLAKKLKELEPRIYLTIIGYCALPSMRNKIASAMQGHSWIELVGGDNLVSHRAIMDQIEIAHFGIIAYPITGLTENSIPTKLYEYLACELPILLQDHQPWINLCNPYHAAIPVNFESIASEPIHDRMVQGKFYHHPPKNCTWDSEEVKLKGAILAI